MESLLFAGALIALVVTLLRQPPSPDRSAPIWRGDWPRHAALLAASAGAAFLTGREALDAWFANSDRGSALEVDLGWIAILPLAAAAIVAFRTFLPSATLSPGAPMPAACALDEPARLLAQPVTIGPAGPGRPQWLVICAVLIGGVLLTALFSSPPLSAMSGWVTSLVFGKPQVIASPPSAGDETSTAPASRVPAQAYAVDQAVSELVSSASSARAARQALSSSLKVALDKAQQSGSESEVGRIRLIIASRERAIVEARQSARNALMVMAGALAANADRTNLALALRQRQNDFQSAPPMRKLLAQISRAEFAPSPPANFVEASMAAWERATAVNSTSPQSSVAKISGSGSDRAQRAASAQNVNSHPLGESTRRSGLNSERHERQPREERRSPEWHPRVQQLPADEFQ